MFRTYCNNEKCKYPEIWSSPKNISQIKVAVQYHYVTDGKVIERSLDDVIKILKETKADFYLSRMDDSKALPR